MRVRPVAFSQLKRWMWLNDARGTAGLEDDRMSSQERSSALALEY